jgi:predicted HicB family RNase H-like nuclease
MSKRKNITEKYEYKVFWSEEDNAYIGLVSEFCSLSAHGETAELALREIKFVVDAAIEWLQEESKQAPQPFSTRKYSGKLNIRIPRELHKELVSESAQQGISLNQLIVYKLSKNLYK